MTAAAPAERSAKTAGAKGGRAGYSVQGAAVQSPAAANDLMRALAGDGYEPHVVRESGGLLKVRVGSYHTRAEAQRIAAQLKRKLGGSPFVVEETR